MHFFGFAVSDEAGTSMAAGNRSADWGNGEGAKTFAPKYCGEVR
jgi:hypothetical protein